MKQTKVCKVTKTTVLAFRLFRHWSIKNKIKAGLWGERLASEGIQDLGSKIQL